MIGYVNTTGYDVGDQIRLNFTVTASTVSTDYVNAAAKLTVWDPTGAGSTYTNPLAATTGTLIWTAVGRYRYQTVPSTGQTGRWVWWFRTTGAVTQAVSGSFAVHGPGVTASDWTFSGDPSASALDETRHLAGDVDGSCPIWTDAQVLYELSEAANSPAAAARNLLSQLAVRAAGAPTSKKVGDLQLTWAADRYDKLVAAAESVTSAVNPRTAPGFFGGGSAARKTVVRQDTDRTRPFGWRGQEGSSGLEFPAPASTGD